MLTCDICGEETLLEEDMKTHVLLCHLEDELQCPLCSLSGVSYDELSLHIASAHPEEQRGAPGPTSAASDGTPPTRLHPSPTAGEPSGTAASSGGNRGPVCPEAQRSSAVTPEAELSDPETADATKDGLHHSRPAADPERKFCCPVCALVFRCPFLLQEHVELHLEQPGDGGPQGDLQLAEKLQQQEELSRRQQEAQLERREFRKLQRQFGLDGRGGYSRQVERSMERAVASGRLAPADFHLRRAEMMEALASGVDDGSSRTTASLRLLPSPSFRPGVVRALEDYYRTESRDGVQVWLSADTDHYSSSAGDRGWGCGYRNFQMLLSALLRTEVYAAALPEKTVPCVPRLQRMIEEAWRAGLDPQGAGHFNQRLQRTRAWIGATEIYVLLTWLGISARILDFHQPTGSSGTHPLLFDWVQQYFSASSRGSRPLPLYLQHQGHSRTVVGVERRRGGGLGLLLLDPGVSASDTRRLLSRDGRGQAVQALRRLPGSLRQQQYQLVAVGGVLEPGEKQRRITASRMLRAERIP